MQATSSARRFSIGQTGGVILGIIVVMGLLTALTLVIRDQTRDQPNPAPQAVITAHTPQNAGEGALGGILPQASAGQQMQASPGLSLRDTQRFYAANNQSLPSDFGTTQGSMSVDQVQFLEANLYLPDGTGDGLPAAPGQFNHPGTVLSPY